MAVLNTELEYEMQRDRYSDPRQFSCMDDFDNDGWGNSTLEREESIPQEEDEKIPLENYTNEEDDSSTAAKSE